MLEYLGAKLWQSGLSQSEIAKKCGISKSTINGYINEKNYPSLEHVIKLKNGLGWSYEYLLGESDNELSQNVSIGKETGLSDKSIAVLNKYANRTGTFEADVFYGEKENTDSYRDILNLLLENSKLEALLYWIREYINAPAKSKCNHSMEKEKLIEAYNKETDEIEKELIGTELYYLETNEAEELHNSLYNYDYSNIVVKEKDVAEFKANQIFNAILKDIFDKSYKEQFKRWKVVKLKNGESKVVPVCNDGSEYSKIIGYATKE